MVDKTLPNLDAVITPVTTDILLTRQAADTEDRRYTRAQIYTLLTGEHLLLPQDNDAVTPTLAFGDGDTGFYEVADGFLNFSSEGVAKFQFGNSITGLVVGAFGLLNQTASATLPTMVPSRGDNDTGLGSSGANQLSLIAGGLEGARVEALQFTMGNYIFDTDQVVGVGTDNFVLTYDDVSGQISLEAATGGGDVTKVGTPVDNQVGVWTGDGTIEGTVGLTYDGAAFAVTGNITVTGTVDGIDIATDVAANTAKVTNATHTGQVTGSGALILDVTAITAQPASGAIVAADTIITNDGGVLSEATFTQMLTFFDANITFPTQAESLLASNAAGPAIVDEAATGTNPTLIPNQAELDTGIGWAAVDTLSFIMGGLSGFVMTTAGLAASNATGPRMLNEAALGTNPTLVPNKGDADTGIGWAAANQLSLVAGGVEAARAEATQFTMINFVFDSDQVVGAGQDNFILTYDDALGTIQLEAAAGGGNVSNTGTPLDNQIAVWTSATVVEGTTGLTYDGAAFAVTGNITVTGTVDGIDIATDVAANTAKLTNATHTGQVTGSGALILDVTAVTAQPASGALVNADTLIVNDGGVLSEATFAQVETFVAATTAVAANTAKVTNATHTGQVTGATALSLAVAAITDQPASGALVAADTILTNDGGVLSESTLTQLLAFMDANVTFPEQFTEYHWGATDFSNPNNTDWEISNLAPAVVDSNDNALTVRAFDDTTQEAVGFQFKLPDNATELTIQWVSRAETAPGAAAVAKPELFFHDIPDNAAVPGNPWSSFSMNDTDIPTNEFFQYDSQTITFSTLSLTAGEYVQMIFARDPAHANDDLTGDWDVFSVNITFA